MVQEQEPNQGNAGEMMIVGLIDHADRLGKSAQSTQPALREQIKELAQLRQWTVAAALDLQKRSDAVIKSLEAERARLQGTQMNMERNAVQAILDATQKQSDDIKRQTVNAFAVPLKQMKDGADYLRHYMRDMKWLTISLISAGGLVIGLLLAYWPIKISLNNVQEQLTRIEQSQAAQQHPVAAPAAPDPHDPTRKGKGK